MNWDSDAHDTETVLSSKKKKKEVMQRCSPATTEFQINSFHSLRGVCWDLMLFHEQLRVNMEELTDLS